jgi:hypothetical protein
VNAATRSLRELSRDSREFFFRFGLRFTDLRPEGSANLFVQLASVQARRGELSNLDQRWTIRMGGSDT